MIHPAPPVVSFVSRKNAGKTTFLEKLIAELRRRGYRVGTVKHDAHGFDIDHEGKDTWRHKQAGAGTVVISSPRKIAMIKDRDEEMALDEIVQRFMTDMDIVLTEGYKKENKPKVEIFRHTMHPAPLHTKAQPGSLVALVSDVAVDLGVPRFDIDAAADVADFLEQRFIAG